MSAELPSKSELVFYQTEDKRTRIQCRFEADTVWMTKVAGRDAGLRPGV